MKDILRIASLAAVLLASSCASPNDPGFRVPDPEQNHPITVDPQYQSVRFPFSVSNAGLMPDDAAKFDAFVGDYLDHGNGALSVTVPAGNYANAAISYFGERLASMGVPRTRVLVGTRAPDGDERVELGFIGYAAHVANCDGDKWNEDLARTWDNQPMPSFGCANQHNLAAMVADPRDLIQPRGMGDPSTNRRTTVLGHYGKGEVHTADKRKSDIPNEQSGSSSDIGH
ncbi:MAG TPA: CpaD family pilus assembly protein [Rhizomicrobium sp.]|nr:CpaD family pilus assembly protein [Rhizomicrobium sp.]